MAGQLTPVDGCVTRRAFPAIRRLMAVCHTAQKQESYVGLGISHTMLPLACKINYDYQIKYSTFRTGDMIKSN